MRLSFIGSGYVGLVSGVVLADVGHVVTCIDHDEAKTNSLQRGISTIYEPDLDELLNKNLRSQNIKFTSIIDDDISKSAAIFIAVGTPSAENGSADLSYVYAAIEAIAKYILPQQIIVIKSTVPPGSTKKLAQYLISKNITNTVVANPEFLREGRAIEDFSYPDHIVIGTDGEIAIEIMQEIYAPFVTNKVRYVVTDSTSAELIKYTTNSFLALKVAFINEIANVCENIGANIKDVSYGVGLDKRIGSKHLKAGPGFGGSCFPKDILAIAHLTKNFTEPCNIIETVIASNQRRKYLMVAKIKQALDAADSSENLANKRLCILGVTFKADTDDVRSSPAIEIIKILLEEHKAVIQLYDPAGMSNASKILPPTEYNINYNTSITEASVNTDAIIILTEWLEFQNYDYSILHPQLRQSIIIDLRNILDRTTIEKQGFKYVNVGT